NSRRKTRKDGKEASPKKNRTGYETQTTELSKMLTLQTLGKNFRRKNAEKKKNHFLTSRRLFGNTINFKNQYLHPDKSKKHLLYPSSYTYSNPQIKDNLFYLKKKSFQ
ncbi:hypothetical protein DW200_18265, partial [Phocaeicola vulgatus]